MKKNYSAMTFALLTVFLLPYMTISYAIDKTSYGEGGAVAIIVIKNTNNNGDYSYDFCLGAYVDSLHVVTAAHCMINPYTEKTAEAWVMPQRVDRVINMDDPNLTSAIAASEIHIHENYVRLTMNDIAVIKLLSPATLPGDGSIASVNKGNDRDKVLVQGDLNHHLSNHDTSEWFIYRAILANDNPDTHMRDYQMRFSAITLYPAQKVKEKFVELRDKLLNCGKYDELVNNMSIMDNQWLNPFIYAFKEGPMSEYEELIGSSGAPIIAYNENDHGDWYLDGFISDGNNFECGQDRFVGYVRFVNTYYYADWIDRTIGHARGKRQVDFGPDRTIYASHTMDHDGLTITVPIAQGGTGFTGWDNVIDAPEQLTWQNSSATEFQTTLTDDNGTTYTVNLIAHLRYPSCPEFSMNSAVVCTTDDTEKKLTIEYADNAHLPEGITLTGTFRLKRQDWTWHSFELDQIHEIQVNYVQRTIM